MSEKNVSREAFAERLDYLRSQPDGWYHGEGKSFRPEDLDQLKTRLEALIGHNQIPWPWLYPVVDTSVTVEREHNGWDVNLTVDFKSRTLWFLAQNEGTRARMSFSGTVFDAAATTNIDGFFAEITTNQTLSTKR